MKIMSTDNKTRVVTTYRLQEMKSRGEKIAMLTAYDYSMARIVDSAGVDVVLVGDSAANVMAGYETTVPMSLEHMIYHARSVTRAVKRALVVVDMPFGTYQGNSKEALASAVRIMKESEADAIKLEGGEEILESVQRILCAGIPVMGQETAAEEPVLAEDLAFKKKEKTVSFREVSFPEFKYVPVDNQVENIGEERKKLRDITLDVSVRIGGTVCSVKDILALQKGQILTLDKQAGSPADVVVNGKLIGKGDVLVTDEKFAARIIEIVGKRD